ncbi:hypothetical protein [Sphaerisporangium sp. TRM90804]|uniref:hypothetical protein n=1 Tax=Sphaerisporangium sp. TRM90804 TaxID=3031113 RepID=UPI0024484744|nr:hypothetical protein [Sphaerisporangium sp. TRM90804]MDH2428319.1 hypothetical protein [Sphaerisporangium sp. TRM90804]
MTREHPHVWTELSRHRTSQGVVVYRHCHCRTWQVVIEQGHRQPEVARVPPGTPAI